MGLPKTLSSALQTEFFSKHDEISYLGVGLGDLISYKSKDLEYLFQVLLIYANKQFYQKEVTPLKQLLNIEFEVAANTNKLVGISSEWFGLNLTPDMIGFEERVDRLYDLFDKNTQIIVITRAQDQLLKSLYGQMVQEGLPQLYDEFLSFLYLFRDRNFFYDLDYYEKFKVLISKFGIKNVHFLPLENFRESTGELKEIDGRVLLIDEFCKLFEIDYPYGFELPIVNPSLNDAEIYQKVLLNKKYRHDFGNLIYEYSNIHRSRTILEPTGLVPDLYQSVKMKRFCNESAKLLSKINPDKRIDYSANPKVINFLSDSFIQSNLKLKNEFGVNLPDCYFSMFGSQLQ